MKNTIELDFRQLRLLVMAIHGTGHQLKNNACCYADGSSANDVLELALRVDDFLSDSERRHVFTLTRSDPEEKDTEDAGSKSDRLEVASPTQVFVTAEESK